MVNDQSGSPTWAYALAQATGELLRQRELIGRHSGIYHLAAGGQASRFEFASAIIGIMQDVSGAHRGWAKVKPIATREYSLPARRPPGPIMSKERVKKVFGIEMPRWQDQLQSCMRQIAALRT